MAYVLGAILGAAAVAALQAIAVAYVVGLLIAAVVVGGVPALLASILVRRGATSHWARRPIGLGALLGLGTAGAIALSLRLLEQSGGEVHFVRPYIPGLVALPLDVVLLLVLAFRGARKAREAARGADLKGGAQSIGMLAARALSRGVAVVIFGAGTLVLCSGVLLAVVADEPDAPRAEFIVMDAIAAFVVGGLGSLFAWWGRGR